MIELGSDKQCKRRWSLKNPDQKGSFKFQQEGPQWVCDMVRLWSDLGTMSSPAASASAASAASSPPITLSAIGWMVTWCSWCRRWWWWCYLNDDVDMMNLTLCWCHRTIGLLLPSCHQLVRKWGGEKHQRWKLPGLHLVHNLHKVLWQQHVFGEIFAMVQLQGLWWDSEKT